MLHWLGTMLLLKIFAINHEPSRQLAVSKVVGRNVSRLQGSWKE